MPASQDRDLVRHMQVVKRPHQILRQIHRECQIVSRVNEQRLSIAKAIEIQAGADRLPQCAQQVELDVAVEPLAHVTRREPAPDDIGEMRRDMVQRFDLDQRFVRRGEQREARPQAGAENPDAIVALERQPRDGPPRVEHRLRQTCKVRATLALTM